MADEFVGAPKIVIPLERIQSTLDRLANIAFGFCWKHNVEYNYAFSNANVALVTACYHLGIQSSSDIDRAIRASLQKGFSVYYTKSGRRREHPMGEQVIDFSEELFKLSRDR